MTTDLGIRIPSLPTDKEWISHLVCAISEADKMGKRVVVIAVARKMARLLEYHVSKDSELKRLLSPGVKNHEIITEHAIPVTLIGRSSSDTEVIILDDLIVFGDTVETISETVFFLTGIRPKIIAMAASDKASLYYFRGDMVYPVKGFENNDNPAKLGILSDKEISAFTAKNSWDIVSLKKSIDLEHTIFKILISKKQAAAYSNLLTSVLKSKFPTDIVYEVSHILPSTGEEVKSVSLCFQGSKKLFPGNDFSKLRFFIGDDCLRIISFSPNIISEEEINGNGTFVFCSDNLTKCWNVYKHKVDSIHVPCPLGFDEVLHKIMYDDFKIRREHSQIVWANYLMSFRNVLLIKEKIISALNEVMGSEPKLEIDADDLSLLLGREMREEFCGYLQCAMADNLAPFDTSAIKTYPEDILNAPLIPRDSEKEYSQRRLLAVHLRGNVHEGLSLIFYRLWRDFGFINNIGREERIRIGETFDSLYKIFSVFYPKEGLREDIYRWIDSRIDLGVVVPKYEYFVDNYGIRNWRRYFRAGEREDLMIDIAKVAKSIMVQKIGYSKVVSFAWFEKEVASLINSVNEEYPHQADMKIFKDGVHRAASKNVPLAFHLWVFMVILGILRLVGSSDWGEAALDSSDEIKGQFESVAIFR